MKLNIGDNAPDFTLLDQDGKSHSLSEYKGNWILLYFYPKDNTPGCTKEACAIRDDFFGFSDKGGSASGGKKLNVIVIGISVDSIKSHKKFAKDYNLPFTLLSDENKKVVKLYGVWGRKKFMGKGRENYSRSENSRPREYNGTFRTSFLVNPKGKIEKIYNNVKPAEHSKEVLEDLKNIIK